jgi:hypothetical protein
VKRICVKKIGSKNPIANLICPGEFQRTKFTFVLSVRLNATISYFPLGRRSPVGINSKWIVYTVNSAVIEIVTEADCTSCKSKCK